MVQDDPSDQYTFISDGASYSGVFAWTTQASSTDGVVVSPINWYGTLQSFQVQVTMSPNYPFTSWFLFNSNSTFVAASNSTLVINRISCTCGNGVVDAFEGTEISCGY